MNTKKDHVFKIRVTEEMKEYIKRCADEEGMTVSAYIRMHIKAGMLQADKGRHELCRARDEGALVRVLLV